MARQKRFVLDLDLLKLCIFSLLFFFPPPSNVEVFVGPLGGERKSKLRKEKEKKNSLKTLSLFSLP